MAATTDTTPAANVAQLCEENRVLRAQLENSHREIEQLSIELEETNKGVLALYAELDDKAQALREASELKSRFLSYMSHEFRTPLGAIRSMARILLDKMDGPLAPEQERQIQFMQQAAVELTEMVNDLLDLAKIEAGRVTISPSWFDMIDIFAALRGMFKPILTNPDVVLVFEEPVEMPKIYTDDKKLSQILRNYISNALKFTVKGRVCVSAYNDGADRVTFAVADTGIGISKEHHDAVFQDFMQIDSALQKKYRGTGLGLSLSKKLAEVLGGSVAMHSEFGVGSTFFVTIPLRFAGIPAGKSE